MALNAPTLNAEQIVAGGEAECYAIIDGKRKWLMNAINLNATYTKKKSEVKVLGSRTSKHKNNGGEGTGTATFYYNTSEFRQIMLDYKKTGKDIYFDIYVTNEDATTNVGRQTTWLREVNLDSVIVAAFDIEQDGGLREDMPFTFDDWDLVDKFTPIENLV